MQRRYFLHILLAVMLFAAQLVAAAHSIQHELDAPQATHCQLCAVAHATPVPPAATTAPLLPRHAVATAVAVPAGLPDPRPCARPNSRAPPLSHLS